jgi:hypothetical protein
LGRRFRRYALVPSLFVVVLSAAFGTASGQEAKKWPLGFEQDRFWARQDTAEWLFKYDQCAWITSDSVSAVAEEYMDRLGAEWFCYERGQQWHAVYGRYKPDSDAYVVALHFVQDSSSGFSRLDELADTAEFLSRARALYNSRSLLPVEVTERLGHFNWYVRNRNDGHLDVWYVPAGLPQGMILFGPEFHYVFGGDGRDLLDSSIVAAELQGAYPDTTLVLDIDNESREVPTVGQILFILRFGTFFKLVRIWNRRFVTAVVEGHWTQVLREDGEGQ